jgi:hypothetical protein
MSVANVLINLGYTEFVVRGNTYEGIEWIEEPETIPTKEQVLAKITELDALEQTGQDAKAAARESAKTKLATLGLTEVEILSLVGEYN